jgi:hypothetical protein
MAEPRFENLDDRIRRIFREELGRTLSQIQRRAFP